MKHRAPIAVFACDRPGLLEFTLAALAGCDGFEGNRVHVFCDAAENEDQIPGVLVARQIARTWCDAQGARLILRQEKLGYRNITDGLTELCANEGCAISLEDDHCPHRGLLAFLDRALETYRDEDRVFQVAAYMMGVGLRAAPDTFFLPMPMPAGWGTWNRAWCHFRWDVESISFLSNPARRRAFDLKDSYPASVLLSKALGGEFQSYFILWYLAMFCAGGLALCSRESLVFNLGLDSGVHGLDRVSSDRQRFFNGAWNECEDTPSEWRFPARIEINSTVFRQICEGLRVRSKRTTGNPICGTP